jgi:FdhD protein
MNPNLGVPLGLQSVSVRRRGDCLEHDFVVIEDPLEIRVSGKPLVVTMRTPGHDTDLAAGFLFGENVINRGSDIASVEAQTGSPQQNTQIRVAKFSGDSINVSVRENLNQTDIEHAQREYRATAACGVCGKTEIKDLDSKLPKLTPTEIDTTLLETLPDILRQSQTLFEASGGIHAAGIFDQAGSLLCIREDIGRHNAVDKAIGHFVRMQTMPLTQHILVVSGRAGFELVQKALKASIPVMVSVGAASSLAVQMATDAGMALYSFAGRGRGNLHVKD